LSQDGQNVVFTSSGHDGGDGVWIADLDRRSPPRQLTRKNETRALFGAPGEIVYMGDDGHLYRMRQDGSGSELVSPDPIVYLMTVSPDGRWAAVINPESGAGGGTSAEFRSLKGGKSFPIFNAKCTLGPRSILAALPFNWTPDGKALFVNLNLFGGGVRRTVVLPYRSDAPIETLWPNGLTTEKNVAANPGARILDDINTFPGADAAEYLVWKSSFQSNLYRVRIPD